MKTIGIDRTNLFFTSDPHYYHANIIKYCNRPFKDVDHMNEILIENWNAIVPREATTFILGDFSYGDKIQWEKILGRLHGYKYLITGNHDRSNVIPKHCFLEVIDGFANIYVKGSDRNYEITLCHFPMLSWQSSHKGSWQLHGHWHSSSVKVPDNSLRDVSEETMKDLSLYVKEESKAYNCRRATQYDVGVDGNGYYPVPFSEVEKIIKKQIENEKEAKQRR